MSKDLTTNGNDIVDADLNKKCTSCGKIMPLRTEICDDCGAMEFTTLDGEVVTETYEENADEKRIAAKEAALKKNATPVSNPVSSPVSEQPIPISKKLEKQLGKRKKVDESKKKGKVKSDKIKKYIGK